MLVTAKRNGWTSGQMGLLRAITSAYLILAFFLIINSPHPHPISSIVAGFGILLSAVRITGLRDRIVALLLLVATLYLRQFFLSFAGMPLISILLIYQAALPQNGVGIFGLSITSVPTYSWRLDSRLFFGMRSVAALIFILLAVGLWVNNGLSSGAILTAHRTGVHEFDYTVNILLTVACAVSTLLCFIQPQRAGLWWLEVFGIMSLAVLSFGTFHAIPVLLLALHIPDPLWFTAEEQLEPEMIFYDGGCGLCHHWVTFVLSEELDRDLFHFAPIGSARFQQAVGSEPVADSIVVQTSSGLLLQLSAAVLHILNRLGGAWRILAFILRPIPKGLLDRLYDLVAKYRKHLFPTPETICPIVPEELRSRFSA